MDKRKTKNNRRMKDNRELTFEQPAGLIAGRNAVTEALKSDRAIDRIVISDGSSGSVSKIVALAKERRVRIDYKERDYLDKKFSGAHQGVLAFAAAREYSTVEEILADAASRNEEPFIIVLDDIEDPHNLGAIMRTAECAGAHGIIIGKNRAVGLTETVAKTSAGAIEYIKVARVTNIARTLDELKEKGIWVCAADMDGDQYTKADLKGALAIVIGNEGKGISRLVKEKCDFIVSLPMKGHISSLNASNAAAILMYEALRQRDEIR